MDVTVIIAGIGLAALALPLVMRWRLKAHWRLDPVTARRLKRAWQEAQDHTDHRLRVLEAEKTFDILLNAWRLEGTFAKKLKQAAWRIPEADAIWSAHRLRNRIAHEPGIRVSPQEAERALAAYGRVITRYI